MRFGMRSGLRVYGGLECPLKKKDGVGTGGERAERARVEESLEKDG
jgi:hypothetical protein